MKTLPKKHCYLIGINAKGKPLYLGKKDSSDPQSRELTLWYTIGTPLVDGSNYHRVLPDDEQRYCEGEFTFDQWINHLREQYCKTN
jgi:hypothetical protein